MKQESTYLYVVVGRDFTLTVTNVKWPKIYKESDIIWKMKCGDEELEIAEGAGKSSFSYTFKEKYVNKTVAFTAYLKDESLPQFSYMTRSLYPCKVIKIYVLPKLEDYYIKSITNDSPRDGDYYSGNVVKLHVSEYQMVAINKVPQKVKQSIQWFVSIDGIISVLTVCDTIFGGDTINFNIPSAWSGKRVLIMACIKSPTPAVSVSINVTGFPIVIDRYKMPGLNRTGTDIADDMTYGFGIARKTPVYSSSFVQKLITSYNHKNANQKLNPNLSNSVAYDPAPSISPIDEMTPLEKAERQNRIINGKAIYSRDDAYAASYKIELPRIKKKLKISTGLDIRIFDTLPDSLLWWDFEQTVLFYFAQGELETNIKAMIAKFKHNKGGIYENTILTNAVFKNHNTTNYCNRLEEYIKNKIKEKKGDISVIEDNKVYFEKEKDIRDKVGKGNFDRPVYSDDKLGGLTIALNDIWATEVVLVDFELSSDSKTYNAKYMVTLWDHFGLDLPDMEKKFNIIPSVGEAFVCWFILQHLRGYKPFITKISFTKEFKGEL